MVGRGEQTCKEKPLSRGLSQGESWRLDPVAGSDRLPNRVYELD